MNPEELEEENRLTEQLEAVTAQANAYKADAVEWSQKYAALHNEFQTTLNELEQARTKAYAAEYAGRKSERRVDTLMEAIGLLVSRET